MIFSGIQLKTGHLGAVQSSHVRPQHARQSEHLAALRALVWLHSSVDATVPRQQRRPREPLVAHRALKRLLAGVHFHVVLQDPRPTEGAVTHCASTCSKGTVTLLAHMCKQHRASTHYTPGVLQNKGVVTHSTETQQRVDAV